MTYSLGGFGLKTKKHIEWLAKASLTVSLFEGKPVQNFTFWKDLVLMSEHAPHRTLKELIAKDQIKCFKGERRDKGVGCVAITKDGEPIVFSYKKCITPQSARDKLVEYCRQEVKPDLIQWRSHWLNLHGNPDSIICPVLRVEVAIADCHIDHYFPRFRLIFKAFEENVLAGVDLEKLEWIEDAGDRPGYKRLANEKLGQIFKVLHAKSTDVANPYSHHLRLISAKANLLRQ